MTEYIDLTPTWHSLMPILIQAAATGNKDAIEELYRLADFADDVNAERKAKTAT